MFDCAAAWPSERWDKYCAGEDDDATWAMNEDCTVAWPGSAAMAQADCNSLSSSGRCYVFDHGKGKCGQKRATTTTTTTTEATTEATATIAISTAATSAATTDAVVTTATGAAPAPAGTPRAGGGAANATEAAEQARELLEVSKRAFIKAGCVLASSTNTTITTATATNSSDTSKTSGTSGTSDTSGTSKTSVPEAAADGVQCGALRLELDNAVNLYVAVAGADTLDAEASTAEQRFAGSGCRGADAAAAAPEDCDTLKLELDLTATIVLLKLATPQAPNEAAGGTGASAVEKVLNGLKRACREAEDAHGAGGCRTAASSNPACTAHTIKMDAACQAYETAVAPAAVSAPADTTPSPGGGGGGGSGNGDIAGGVVAALLLLAVAAAAVYWKLGVQGKEGQTQGFTASFSNPAYERGGNADDADDGELYSANAVPEAPSTRAGLTTNALYSGGGGTGEGFYDNEAGGGAMSAGAGAQEAGTGEGHYDVDHPDADKYGPGGAVGQGDATYDVAANGGGAAAPPRAATRHAPRTRSPMLHAHMPAQVTLFKMALYSVIKKSNLECKPEHFFYTFQHIFLPQRRRLKERGPEV